MIDIKIDNKKRGYLKLKKRLTETATLLTVLIVLEWKEAFQNILNISIRRQSSSGIPRN